MPLWMMKNIKLGNGDFVKVSTKELPAGEFVKFQPQSTDFLDITDPKAVLEHILRKYAALSVNENILFRYNNKDYYLKVLEIRPNRENAISIIEVNLDVDFAPPDGYEESYTKPEKMDRSADSDEDSEDSETEWESSKFIPFQGHGRRISGKPVESSSAQALSRSPLSVSPSPLSNSPSPLLNPSLMHRKNTPETTTPSPLNQKNTPETTSSPLNQKNTPETTTYEPFKGKGYALK